jgi:hypothetical protein
MVRDSDLANAIHFLSRISVGRLDEELLIQTVDALRRELERRKHERRKRQTG